MVGGVGQRAAVARWDYVVELFGTPEAAGAVSAVRTSDPAVTPVSGESPPAKAISDLGGEVGPGVETQGQMLPCK